MTAQVSPSLSQAIPAQSLERSKVICWWSVVFGWGVESCSLSPFKSEFIDNFSVAFINTHAAVGTYNLEKNCQSIGKERGPCGPTTRCEEFAGGVPSESDFPWPVKFSVHGEKLFHFAPET